MTKLEYEAILAQVEMPQPPKTHKRKRFEQRRLVERVWALAHKEGMKDARAVDDLRTKWINEEQKALQE